MTETSLKDRITNDMKDAMRAKDSGRLGVIRFLQAAIKQREVDERIVLDDTEILSVLNKSIKQRRDSEEQFTAAGRVDLAEKEAFERSILEKYLPPQLDDSEVETHIKAAITETGAQGMQDMGKVMAQLKPTLQGRADMGAVSAKIKALLG
ncbi:MAG: GatB/YqeY domain-containing protein [Pseudomonadota bacterium]|nr:GatB/YqeY domain-containing protein [Pseudomonadota bacterium]